MIRGTTPTLTLTIRNETVDLSEAANIYVTLRQGVKEITVSDGLEIGTPRTVQVFLTQEQSLGLVEGKAEIQVNWTYPDPISGAPRRAATKVKTIPIDKQLLRRVIA